MKHETTRAMTYKLGKKRLPTVARADSEWLADVRGEVSPLRLQFNPTAKSPN